ncbi:MAG: glycosyltransferase [Candidatus Accumulibacter sp. UW26]|jgi:glycosyltransferase involved in cell wall biosynthesis
MIFVSIILPALAPTDDFCRCIHSIRAALSRALTFEVICVVPDVDVFAAFADKDVHIIKEDVAAIYGAMNLGCRESTGRYIYFIGQDDILLPSAARALCRGGACNADIILADVFWGPSGIFRNSSDSGVLVWRNWCHQGIFYNRLKFMDLVGAYPLKYPVQADHYANIVFGKNPDVLLFKHEECVAWYASDGFSTRVVDTAFRQDFPALVRRHFGIFAYITVVLRRFLLKIYRRAVK